MFSIAAHSLPSSSAAWFQLWWTVSLKATLLLAAAGLLAVALTRASAATRHLVWSVALAGAIALPALALWGPSLRVRGLALPAIVASEARGAVSAGPAVGLAKLVAPDPGFTEASIPAAKPGSAGMVTMRSHATDLAGMTGMTGMPASRPEPARRWSWQAALLALWATGAIAMLASLLVGALLLLRFSARAGRVTDPEWLGLQASACATLGLRRPVELLSHDRVSIPCTWGLLRAHVLVPAAADRWPIERRRVVLLHELAHVARRDCLVQTLAQVACALFWFHPLAWLAARRLRIERERACDDLVLRADTRAADYADHLLAVVRTMRESRLAAIGAVAFARPSQFEGRLLAVLDPARARGALTATRVWRAVALAALLVAPLAMLRPWVGGAAANTILSSIKTKPEDGAPSELVRAPESEVGLVRRLSWAVTQAGRREAAGFWVAYQIPRYDHQGGNLSDNGDLDIATLGKQWPGPRMADVLAGRSMRDPAVVPDPNELTVAFHFRAGGSRPEDVDRIRAQSQELAAAFERQPLFWLGDMDERESLDWVRRVELGARNEKVRATALEVIASHADDDAVRTHLSGVLKSDRSSRVRSTAAERLGRFSDPATLELLVKTMHDDASQEVRMNAIEGLGQTPSPASTHLLSKLARDAREPEALRRAAIEALGEKAGADAVASLESQVSFESVKAVEGVAPRVTVAAPEAAPETPAPVVVERPGDPTDLEAPDAPETSLEKIEKARQDQQEVVEQVREQREQAREQEQIRKQERKESKKLESKAEHNGEEDAIQCQAVQALGRMPEETSLPKLVQVARTHPNPSVRREALSSLGLIGSDRSRKALLDFAWQDRDEDLACEATDALGQCGRSAPGLMDLAHKHPSIRVRRQAVQSLGQMGPEPKVLETLDDLALNDPSEEVEREAVQALAQLPEEVSLRRLEKIARSHPRSAVRREAIDALGNFDPEKAASILESLIDGKGK